MEPVLHRETSDEDVYEQVVDWHNTCIALPRLSCIDGKIGNRLVVEQQNSMIFTPPAQSSLSMSPLQICEVPDILMHASS